MSSAKIAVIDYRCGNLKSVINGISRFGASVDIVSSPEQLDGFDKYILPGVGAFGEACNYLRTSGFSEALDEKVRRAGKPLLGICLGMQLLCEASDELGRHEGLGWINAEVKSLRKSRSVPESYKVPHMGWNSLNVKKDHPLVEGIECEADVYFVHSFAVRCENQEDILATCKYGTEFVAAFASDNIMGVQFHPEKSHRVGLRMLENFVAM